jgi:hypothetical protein
MQSVGAERRSEPAIPRDQKKHAPRPAKPAQPPANARSVRRPVVPEDDGGAGRERANRSGGVGKPLVVGDQKKCRQPAAARRLFPACFEPKGMVC